MQFERNNTEITIRLPKICYGYFTSKFRSDKIETITGNQQRIWIGILNRSLTDMMIIKKNKPFGFFVLESKGEVNIRHEMAKNTKKTSVKYRKRTQSGGFLQRYDFAYAGRDTVNQVGKTAPGTIKNASSKIKDIAD